ncbi:MAG: 30S ribosomal protein S20 [Gammaproteobacteria bacterium]|nr:30S ribosomal protein S20 [Gammaproteobacteria bacterium]
MANTASAKKRVRQSTQKRMRNAEKRSKVRTAIKQVKLAIEEKKKEEAEQLYRKAVSVIDKVTQKGILHKNKAARHKSRLHQRIKALSTTL